MATTLYANKNDGISVLGTFRKGSDTYAVQAVSKTAKTITVSGDAHALAGKTIWVDADSASGPHVYTVTTAVYTSTTLLTVTDNAHLVDQVEPSGAVCETVLPAAGDTCRLMDPGFLLDTDIAIIVSSGAGSDAGALSIAVAEIASNPVIQAGVVAEATSDLTLTAVTLQGGLTAAAPVTVAGEVTLDGGSLTCEDGLIVADGGTLAVPSDSILHGTDVLIERGGTLLLASPSRMDCTGALEAQGRLSLDDGATFLSSRITAVAGWPVTATAIGPLPVGDANLGPLPIV